MKKLLRMLAASALCAGLITGAASAQSSITNTGPGSNNTITHNNSCDSTVNNDTDIDVNVDNDQDADSGNATNNDNTSGGNSQSGDASNDSSIDVNLDVNNNSGNACAPASDTTTPPSGGSGGGETLGSTTPVGGRGAVLAAGTQIAALPNTGTTAPAEYATVSVAALSGLALALRVGVAVYRRFSL